MRIRIDSITAEPLSVPLIEPFVIASGRVDVTPSVLVTARVTDLDTGRVEEGLGESAALPPVTREEQKDVLFTVMRVAALLRKRELAHDTLAQVLAPLFAETPVARAGVETALLDATARLMDVPLFVLLNDGHSRVAGSLTTDMTLPIGDANHMAELATGWRAKGFRCFKVKVGKNLEEDLAALEAIQAAVPDATYRIDANAGYSASEAIALVRAAEAAGCRIECFEQPCGRLALDANAEVAAAIDPPVIADESVSTQSDLDRLIAAKAADGVNLKLAKSGGPLAALAIGRAARRAGLQLMVGSMVETRLGVTAAAHLAAALGRVEYPDLDTAWLLAEDPFLGGYEANGPNYTLPMCSGLGVTRR